MAIAFLAVLQSDLEEHVHYWNTHHIRPSRLASCPSGRPDDMYDMPQLYGM